MTTIRPFDRAALLEAGIAPERLERAGIPDGMPVVLGDDGRPISVLNRWLRSLPTRGGRSPNTWAGYAKDTVIWQRHLDEHGVDLFADRRALRDALETLYVCFRIDPALEDRWSPATWNRLIAAVDNFYNWAVEEECWRPRCLHMSRRWSVRLVWHRCLRVLFAGEFGGGFFGGGVVDEVFAC